MDLATSGATVLALSSTATSGLILGGGALGCGLLVLGLTVAAVRRGARAEAASRRQEQKVKAAAARLGRSRGPAAGAGPDEPGAHDPYPAQPYSAAEPRTHKPYSRPYKQPQVPRQESHAKKNGHRPPDSAAATGIPTTPYPPPEDEG